MTKDKALRMAIEALIYHTEQTRPIEDTDKAIQACKEALAETQEPMIIKQENGMVLKLGYDELPNGTAFYTTPPSREWQSLSDEEIKDIEYEYAYASIGFARAIEAKLREING